MPELAMLVGTRATQAIFDVAEVAFDITEGILNGPGVALVVKLASIALLICLGR